MASSPASPVTPTPVVTGVTESEAVMRLLGTDPWMRFDMWANRAWEATDRAIRLTVDEGDGEGLDMRAVALFHAAEVAREFAEMVNPLAAVSGLQAVSKTSTVGQLESMDGMIFTEDDPE